MKNASPKSYLATLLRCLFILLGFSVFGFSKIGHVLTDPIKDRKAKPNMWVRKGYSDSLELNFRSKQDIQLTTNMGVSELDSIFYPIQSLAEMIYLFKKNASYNLLNVYLASYDNGSKIPDNLKGRLTLLFKPSSDCSDDSSPFYSFTPDGILYQETKFKKKLNRYKTKKSDNVLKGNLEDADENRSKKIGLTDTRKIIYDARDIDGLIDEIKYQWDTNHVAVSGIMARFSSYPATGKPEGLAMGQYKNRILVFFEFTTKTADNQRDSVFYIDDQVNFDKRKEPEIPGGRPIPCSEYGYKGNDNGHLCPPNCP